MEDFVEVKIWIKDKSVRKVFLKGALNTLPLILVVMIGYFLSSVGVIPVRYIAENKINVFLLLFLVLILASAVSLLYAVGAGFQDVSELEKKSRKTRIIFRHSKIEFIDGLNCSEKNWSEISRIKETVDGFRIYPEKEDSFFIDEFAFQTRRNLQKFKEIVRSQLGERAKLKK